MIALAFIGQTGSGKTTLACRVADEHGLRCIASGDIARDMAQRDRDTSEALSVGEMAPELAMRAEVQARIEAAIAATGDFVIEGFPRTVEQLFILESVPKIQPVYFVLEADPLICLRRLVQRGREHDHPDAVGMRFRTFTELTEPMLEVIDSATVPLNAQLPIPMLLEQVRFEYQIERRRSA